MIFYEDRKKIIGERIKAEREKQGLSKPDLLEKICMSANSHKSVTAWEKGEILPSLDNLAQMAELFDCDIGYLLGDYDERTRDCADVCKVTGLSAEAVEMLQSINNLDGKVGLEIASKMLSDFKNFWGAVKNVNYARFAHSESEKPMSDYLSESVEKVRMINALERNPSATFPKPSEMVDMNIYHASLKFSECIKGIIGTTDINERGNSNG